MLLVTGVKGTNILCYGAYIMQNIMSEMSYAKCWNIMLKMQIVCSKYKKCSYILCSRAEVYIHVAIQNFTTWLSYTELRIRDGQQTISDQFCCMSDHFSKISSQVWLEIHCFTMFSWPLSLLIMSIAYWYIQQKLDNYILVSYIDQFKLSWCLRYPN